MLIENFPDDLGQENRTAVLVISCKRFEQAWDPFFILFKRYWPDCPYRLYFGVDSGNYPGVSTFSMGFDPGWGSICLNSLRNINADRIILLQEDFFIKAKVDTKKIRKLVRHAHDFDIGCLRICPCPGPTEPWHGSEELGVIGLNEQYRVSLQISIWKKSVLTSVIQEGDSVWQVEINGTQRSRALSEPFVSIWRESYNTPGGPVPYIITGIVKGVWQDNTLDLFKQEGLSIDKIIKKII